MVPSWKVNVVVSPTVSGRSRTISTVSAGPLTRRRVFLDHRRRTAGHGHGNLVDADVVGRIEGYGETVEVGCCTEPTTPPAKNFFFKKKWAVKG